jgi:hypothetical protein
VGPKNLVKIIPGVCVKNSDAFISDVLG